MDHSIVCPNCKKTIESNSIIEDAAKRTGSDSQSVICECGERISYWKITDQLRAQRTLGSRVQDLIRSFSPSRN